MAKRLLGALMPLGLDRDEKLSYGRRGTSLLEDTDADGNGRGGCTGGEEEAWDVGFEKYAFFLPAVRWLDKEITVEVLKWADTKRNVSSAKQSPSPGLAAKTGEGSFGSQFVCWGWQSDS